MTAIEAIQKRHSVRNYTDQKIGDETVSALNADIGEYNRKSGLNIQLITDEPKAFSKSILARYGKFSGVNNYFAFIAPKNAGLDEEIGYYGEQLVIKAQQMGLNTCWVAGTYSKGKCGATIGNDEKLVCVIALGYGATQGTAHKSKPIESLYKADGTLPDWFRLGMEAVILAPTAMNQQKFFFTLSGNTVKAEAKSGFYSKIDLGIVKYHFEVGAGTDNFNWAESDEIVNRTI